MSRPSDASSWPDPDWTGWPEAASDEAASTVFAAKVDARKLRIQAAIDRARKERLADLAQNGQFQQALIDIAKGGLGRALANAELVQKAAAAVGTIYTGVLAVVFSVSRPVPPRGLLPALFLGLSIVLSAAYLSFVASATRQSHPVPRRRGP